MIFKKSSKLPVFIGTEVGALFLLVFGARMRILLSLPGKRKAPPSVEVSFKLYSKIHLIKARIR